MHRSLNGPALLSRYNDPILLPNSSISSIDESKKLLILEVVHFEIKESIDIIVLNRLFQNK